MPVSRYGKVIDHSRCVGCHACTTACRSENEVPLGVTRTYVKSVDVGTYPEARRAFQVTRCNQCENPPCVAACPTHAIHQRPDGIVDIDHRICIGCKACMAACPYDAIFINPDTQVAEKCNLCAHRLEVGLEPACVVVCPVEAILVGDLDDPASLVAQVVSREPVTVRRPEKDTRPKLFYVGATEATLDPLAARTPDGGIFMWSEQGAVPHQVPSGSPEPAAPDAPLLSYDIPHRAPWDWRVSLYTFTKSIAAGTYLVAAMLVLFGRIGHGNDLWIAFAPIAGLAGLMATGLVLVADLSRPERFWFILSRPHWTSWLARGAVILLAYGAVLVLHLLLAAFGADTALIALAVAGIPLAVATAAYTAFLLAESRGRDLWQNPLLAPHLVVQAVLAGAGVLALAASRAEVGRWLAGAALLHVVLALAEIATPAPTAHARAAHRLLVRGRQAPYFWAGIGLTLAGALLVPVAMPLAGIVALAGLLSSEHAYIQAGQGVPLA
jgi:Fe-S-cluster-containing dehydrogenase component/formate-dependent nitrite reductase membrane component NrfD